MSKSSTSLQLFRSHIKRLPDGTLDVSALVSKECYLEWLEQKFATASDQEALKYHRSLTNHVSGVDGRTPFDPEEEAAILAMFRKKEPWPCFPEHLASIGKRYRSKGYHEKQHLRQQSSSAASPPSLVAAASAAASATSSTTHALPPPYHPPHITVENVDTILNSLSPTDAAFVRNLGHNVAQNFSSPEFSFDDWLTINQIARFVFVSKTVGQCSDAARLEKATRAKVLCDKFSAMDDTHVVLVADMTAKTYEQRALAQNLASLQHFGHIVGNPTGTITDGGELFRIVLAVGAALHKPGVGVGVLGLKTTCANKQTKLFDMFYYVDPDSFLLVLFGRQCARQ